MIRLSGVSRSLSTRSGPVEARREIDLEVADGRIREILDIKIPRPRTLGRTAYQEEVARCSAELPPHDVSSRVP